MEEAGPSAPRRFRRLKIPMPFEDPDQLCLKGSLILADPSLRDPNFFRSVLLLTEHRHDHGAHGYILNRPLGKKVSEVLASDDFSGLHDVPIFIGGPVSQEHLTFVSLTWQPSSHELAFATHLSTEEAKRRRAEGQTIRAFIGYSGWGEGQLEAELRKKAWITRKPEAAILRGSKGEDLWNRLLSSMGPYYRMLANSPEDPSLN
jgi:putative transcriptional regulator